MKITLNLFFFLLFGFLTFGQGTWKHLNAFNSNLPQGGVVAVASDQQNTYWLACTSAGLTRVNADFANLSTYHTGNSPIPSNSMTTITVDKKNVVWMGTFSGVASLKNGNWSVFDATFAQVPFGTPCLHIAVDSLNRKWFVLQNTGLAMYNDTSWAFFPSVAASPDYGASFRTAFAPNGDQYLCLSSTNGGIFRRSGNGPWTQFTASNGLSDNGVRWVAPTASGSVWLGTNNGVSKLTGIAFSNLVVGGNAAFPQTVDVVKEDRFGTLWVGAYSSGNSPTFKYENGTWTRLQNLVGNQTPTNVTDIEEDRNGNLLLVDGSGLYKYQRTTAVQEILVENPLKLILLNSGKIALQHPPGTIRIRCVLPEGRTLEFPVKPGETQTLIPNISGICWIQSLESTGKIWQLKSSF